MHGGNEGDDTPHEHLAFAPFAPQRQEDGQQQARLLRPQDALLGQAGPRGRGEVGKPLAVARQDPGQLLLPGRHRRHRRRRGQALFQSGQGRLGVPEGSEVGHVTAPQRAKRLQGAAPRFLPRRFFEHPHGLAIAARLGQRCEERVLRALGAAGALQQEGEAGGRLGQHVEGL